MRFSIIIPLYNCEKFLDKLFCSLNNQENKDFEVVFIDDKSTDKTLDKFEKIKENIDYNYKFLKNYVNLGPGTSRNTALMNASGEYVLFLDSDDAISPETMKVLTETVEKENYPDAVLFDYTMVYPHKRIRCSTIPNFDEGYVSKDDAIIYSTGGTWCKVYKNSIIKNNNAEFPDMRTKEDFVFNKIVLSFCETIYYKKEYMYEYNIHEDSVVMKTGSVGADNIETAIKRADFAFDLIEKSVDKSHMEAITALKVKEYLFGTVQAMLRLNTNSKRINAFMDDFEKLHPEWYNRELHFGKYVNLYLYFIRKRNIIILRIITRFKDKLKFYMSRKH